MIAITGQNSVITQRFVGLLPEGETTIYFRTGTCEFPVHAERYLFCAGMLQSKTIAKQSVEERAESLKVNALAPIETIEAILDNNPHARICIVGSESGFAWSYDDVYAAAKAALHRYVETKKLASPNQQLVCISPSIIKDAGMTTRRLDKGRLKDREQAHPKRRFLTSLEVANFIHYALYVDQGYLTGQVIRMNGGEHI